MGVPATSALSEYLLAAVTDVDITGSNWSAMIKCLLGASCSFLSDEAQYREVLNRTHRLHALLVISFNKWKEQSPALSNDS